MQVSAADIVHLTDDNFSKVASQAEDMMVFFYSLCELNIIFTLCILWVCDMDLIFRELNEQGFPFSTLIV